MAPASGHEDFVPNVLFGWDPLVTATVILVVAYVFIVSERINRTVVALLGAGLMVGVGVLNQATAIQGIDFNTLALLIGMMGIVGITKKSGVFQYVAILSAKLVKANPRLLMAVLFVVTAVLSALLDNVTTVMLIVPITILLTDQLKLPVYPFLFSQIFASNIGGTATLIGDPPNIMIGSAVGLSFMDFVNNVALPALLVGVVTILIFDLLWGRKMSAPQELRSKVLAFDEKEAIDDKSLLVKSLSVMVLVLAGFVFGHGHGLEPGSVALFGAALLMLLDGLGHKPEAQSHKVHKTFEAVEWGTIFFFIGLFILVYGVETTGLLNILAGKVLAVTEGDIAMTGLLVLWSSAIVSAIVDNIPFVATMIPMIEAMGPELGGKEALMPLWWCLALGACLGGNGSLVGASANLIVAGYAEQSGNRIPFLKFMLMAFPLMIVSIIIASVYVWFAYFQ